MTERKRRWHHKNKTINSKSWTSFFKGPAYKLVKYEVNGIRCWKAERI